ncbi:MAG: hypothetical protein HC773_07055 [Scytonema sp. CRU_2_7]|nr:hypothetical protein [Scytonema sp. CRU_2_7]
MPSATYYLINTKLLGEGKQKRLGEELYFNDSLLPCYPSTPVSIMQSLCGGTIPLVGHLERL